MSENLNNNLESLFSKMEQFISTKTVIGETIQIGDVIIVPVVDVSFALGAGAAEGVKDKDSKESNGGVLGGKITPSAVLVIINGNVQLVSIKNQDSLNKLIDMVPGIAAKFHLGSLFGNKEGQKEEQKAEPDTKPMAIDADAV